MGHRLANRKLHLFSLLLILFVAACGSGDPAAPVVDDPGPGDLPPPNPEGVLLPGQPTDLATDAVTDLPPSAADEQDIRDGVLTTRLLGLLAPGATVAQINANLDAVQARIVSMQAGNPFVSLKVPAVADRAEATALAATIQGGGGFIAVLPARAVPTEPAVTEAAKILPESGVSPEMGHLIAQGFPAAWNVRDLGIDNQEEITVLVPDLYTSSLPHTEIDAQSMAGYGAPTSLPGPDIYPGNQGFVVSGIIGANFDDTPVTGTSPAPTDLLDIVSMPIGGLTWFDLFNMLSWQLASSGDRFVLNTGLVYNDPTFAVWSEFDRALHALAWRVAAATHYNDFVHVTSSGSAANIDLESPFIASSRADDVRDLIDFEGLAVAEQTALDDAWASVIAAVPGSATASTNVLVVAPAQADGSLLPGSAGGDVRALGVGVHGPCASADPSAAPGSLCDGSVAVYGGGGVAAAQVSGLAAYMLSLVDRTPAEVAARIVSSGSSNGLIDAYAAVRSLDDDATGDVHRTLFDVAGVEPAPGQNGKFDEIDLQLLISPFKIGGGGGSPHDRYDFNGDGTSNPGAAAPFDIDGNGSIDVSSFLVNGTPLTLDEQSAGDFDVLCYYAYSDLYQGDLDARDTLLLSTHSNAFVEVTFPEVIEPGVATTIEVRAGIDTGGTISYVEGVDIRISASDGNVAQEQGLTGAGGSFSTTITLEDDENDTNVDVSAGFPGGEWVRTELEAHRPNSIVFVGRESDTQVWVSASYSVDEFSNLTILYDHGKEVDLEDFTGGYQHDLTDEDSASGTSGYSSQARARQNSDVYVQNGDEVTGAFVSFLLEGSSSIAGTPDHYGYQAWSSSTLGFEVDFKVWGESAEFTLSGTISTPFYSIYLADVRCDFDENPCSSISASGQLAPDREYRLSVRASNHATVEHVCGDDDPFCTTSGSVDYSGSLDVNLGLSHPGDAKAKSAPITRRYYSSRAASTSRRVISWR